MIEKVTDKNVEQWATLASQCWSTDKDKLQFDYQQGRFPHEFLYSKNGRYIAFMSLAIRKDYVEGAVSSPVAYLEGIFVLPDYQQQKVATELLNAAQDWAISRGLRQFASDCELSNELSQVVHKKLGFQEVSRTVHFIKDLNS